MLITIMLDKEFMLFAEVSCGIPPPPPHWGGYAFSGVMSGDSVTYDCECGFDLAGPQILDCGESGHWGVPPCCKSKKTILSKL